MEHRAARPMSHHLMKITWISGWAIYPETIKKRAESTLPHATHHIYSPTANALKEIQKAAPADLLIGHSLGAFLILLNPKLFSHTKKTLLIAPFLDFKKESKSGGLVSLTQLKLIRRWLGKAPITAIADFYQRSQLGKLTNNTLPYAIDDLMWGIDVLINESVNCPNLKNVLLYGGRQDPLLNFSQMQACLPNIEIIANADHKLENFIKTIIKHAL